MSRRTWGFLEHEAQDRRIGFVVAIVGLVVLVAVALVCVVLSVPK